MSDGIEYQVPRGGAEMPRHWKALFFIAIGITFLLLVYYLRTILTPVFIALAIAYLLDPAADWLEARRIPRTAATLIPLVGALLVIVLALALFIPFIVEQLRSFLVKLPVYLENIRGYLVRVLDIDEYSSSYEMMKTGISQLREALNVSALQVIRPVSSVIGKVFGNTLALATGFLSLFIVPLISFYFLRDIDRIKAGVVSHFPPASRERWVGFFRDIDGVLSGFIRGQLTVCTILAVLYSVGFLVIGVDFAILVGIFTGFAFIIPYLGTVVGALVALVLCVAEFGVEYHSLLVIIWVVLVQVAESYFITPKVVGGKVGLNVLEVILSLLIGGQVFGFLGLLIAIPAAASLKVIARNLLAVYRASRFFGAGLPRGEDSPNAG